MTLRHVHMDPLCRTHCADLLLCSNRPWQHASSGLALDRLCSHLACRLQVVDLYWDHDCLVRFLAHFVLRPGPQVHSRRADRTRIADP